jgi:flagellar biogenesis protein FliO
VPNNAYFAVGFQEILGLVLGVLVFIAVLGGFVYLSKRVQKGTVLSGRRIKTLDRMMVSRDSAILLVQVGARLLAVGVGKGPPSFLCEFSASDFPGLSAKTGTDKEPSGFWRRFARNMKNGITGGNPIQSQADTSFAEVLRQMTEKDPVPGGENAGDAGYPLMWEEERRPAPNRFRRSYQHSIDNMNRLSEPDRLDRRSRYYGDPEERNRRPAPPFPPPEPSKPVVNEEERTERIDRVLDLISQRQSRMDERNELGEER